MPSLTAPCPQRYVPLCAARCFLSRGPGRCTPTGDEWVMNVAEIHAKTSRGHRNFFGASVGPAAALESLSSLDETNRSIPLGSNACLQHSAGVGRALGTADRAGPEGWHCRERHDVAFAPATCSSAGRDPAGLHSPNDAEPSSAAFATGLARRQGTGQRTGRALRRT